MATFFDLVPVDVISTIVPFILLQRCTDCNAPYFDRKLYKQAIFPYTSIYLCFYHCIKERHWLATACFCASTRLTLTPREFLSYMHKEQWSVDIIIRCIPGQSFPLRVAQSLKCFTLKEFVYDKTNVIPELQCLGLSSGKMIHDNDFLDDYGITNGATIFVILNH